MLRLTIGDCGLGNRSDCDPNESDSDAHKSKKHAYVDENAPHGDLVIGIHI